MTNELKAYIKSCFTEFSEDLKQGWGVPPDVIKAVDSQLRGLHKRYLGLAVLATVLGDGQPRADYVAAVPEVTHLSMVLILKGLENPAFVLMRQSIELILKHIYFAHHPVEHSWSAKRIGYREISFQFLLDYLRKTDEVQEFTGGAELLQAVELEFHILSRYVHVHSGAFIRFSHFSGHATPHLSSLKSYEERSKELWPKLFSLMFVCMPTAHLRASTMELQLVLASLPADVKAGMKGHLKKLSIDAALT
jgi:hypothetical protein